MPAVLSAETKNWLVQEAEETLNAVSSERDFNKQTAQLRNMVQITQTECEVKVLRNFVRYQAGRDATKKFWNLIEVRVLRTLEQIGEKFSEEAVRRLALQSYFGYMVRHYVYLTGRR